jgi:hypothetical protein
VLLFDPASSLNELPAGAQTEQGPLPGKFDCLYIVATELGKERLSRKLK